MLIYDKVGYKKKKLLETTFACSCTFEIILNNINIDGAKRVLMYILVNFNYDNVSYLKLSLVLLIPNKSQTDFIFPGTGPPLGNAIGLLIIMWRRI